MSKSAALSGGGTVAILARLGSSSRPGVEGSRKPLLEACQGGGLVASRSEATSHRTRAEPFWRLIFLCCCARDGTPPT